MSSALFPPEHVPGKTSTVFLGLGAGDRSLDSCPRLEDTESALEDAGVDLLGAGGSGAGAATPR